VFLYVFLFLVTRTKVIFNPLPLSLAFPTYYPYTVTSVKEGLGDLKLRARQFSFTHTLLAINLCFPHKLHALTDAD
jgi:hypothetical protein